MRTTRRAISVVAASVLFMAALAPAVAFADEHAGEEQASDVRQDGDNRQDGDRPDDVRQDGDNRQDGDRPDDVRQDGDNRQDGDRPDDVRQDGDNRQDGDRPDDVRQDGDNRQDDAGANERDYSDNPAVDDRGKVWVCKYVGQPGVDERPKDGKNPIHVSWNTLQPNIVESPDEIHVGLEWIDAQDGSHVVVIDPGTDCPVPDPDPDPEYFVAFTKAWTGDGDFDDTNVSFTVDGTDLAPGATYRVELGETLDLDETVTGLGECTYTSDLPDTYEVPTGEYDDGHVFTITVTNDVTCPDGTVLTPGISLTKTAIDVGPDNTVTLDDDGEVDVTYRYLITNTGNVDLDLTVFDDDRIGDLIDELDTTVLTVALGSMTVDVTTTLTAADFDGEGDTHTNVASVETAQGPDDSATETITLVEVDDTALVSGAPDDRRPVEPQRPVVEVRGQVTIAQPSVVRTAAAVAAPTQAAQLPRTGGDSLLGMVLAALVALGIGMGLLQVQPARARRSRTTAWSAERLTSGWSAASAASATPPPTVRRPPVDHTTVVGRWLTRRPKR